MNRSLAGARIVRLDHERSKLLEAFYDGGIPTDLLKREQDRINMETAAAQRMIADANIQMATVGKPLDQALELAGDCQRAYVQAGPQIRRMFNRVFFTALRLTDGDVTGVDLSPAFAELLAEDLASRLEQERENPANASFWQGSSNEVLVALSRQFSNTPPPERPNRRKLVLDRQEMSGIEGLLSERQPEK